MWHAEKSHKVEFLEPDPGGIRPRYRSLNEGCCAQIAALFSH